MSKLSGLNKPILERLYIELDKTDREIAEFFDVDRTTIVHARKKHEIKGNGNIGREGELAALAKLKSLNYSTIDLNKTNKLSEFDILVDENIRVDVKSSNLHQNRFVFAFSEQDSRNCVVSDTRIRLKNGRTMKVYSETCDFLILVGFLPSGNKKYWVVPSKIINEKTPTIYISTSQLSKDRYDKYLNNWDLLRSDTH